MTPSKCPRLFQAEAMRDGRLAGAELSSFERHLTVCLACSTEVRALDTLAEAVRRAGPRNAEANELHVRRERTRLLGAFDRNLITPARGRSAPWVLWPSLVAALVAVFLFFRRGDAPLPPERASVATVRADPAAVWSENREGNVDRIRLERGALFIRVERASERVRVVVVLPDGELEDIGTTFTVSAEDGRTTRVAVQDGSVVLRLRNRRAVVIGPGETWTAETQAAPPVSPSASDSANASAAAGVEAVASGRVSSAVGTPLRAGPAPAVPSALADPLAAVPSSSKPDPAVDFRAAMAALRAGDHSKAAAAFEAFLVKYPRDPRGEDAAYLRVIALQRSGDVASTRRAAQDYLRRHPSGFRRTDVEALAR
jgi:TolA-binding protein